MNRRMDGWMHACMIWMDLDEFGWMDGLLDGLLDGRWMDGWIWMNEWGWVWMMIDELVDVHID